MIEEIKNKIGQHKLVYDLKDLTIEPTTIMALDIETHGHAGIVGDSPCYNLHGVAGIALGNMHGDSCYVVVNDGRDYKGVPIKAAMDAINWRLAQSKVVLLHYSKFDLGFLIPRGLKLENLRVVDTWMLTNIKSCGIYSANKLKEIVRKKLNITTDTEAVKTKWMEDNKTLDYGDVPVEIMGTYACDDVRYTVLAWLHQESLSTDDWTCHDLYIRNNLHLIAAETRGVCLNIPLLKQRLEMINKFLDESKAKIKNMLGATDVDIDDDQKILRYLHEKNLHSAPRDQYGETKFVLDPEFIIAADHELSNEYLQYHRRKAFRTCFSGSQGEMLSRIFVNPDGQAGFHVSHLSSTFSKGAIPQCKQPDLTDRILIQNEIRQLFIPRKGFQFSVLRAVDLPTLLLGFYCNDVELMAAVRASTPDNNQVLKLLENRTGLDQDFCSLLLKQTLEGSGVAVLERRVKACKLKFSGNKNALYPVIDRFQAGIKGYKTMQENLGRTLDGEGFVRDRVGRVLKIEQKSRYRSQAALIQSSNGSLLSYYLDLFCRTANATGSHLVLANQHEFVFEVPEDSSDFMFALHELGQKKLIDPAPEWEKKHKLSCWSATRVESHEEALYTL